MHLISDLKPAFARLTRLSTLAVASTVTAAVGTTWLITGTVDPSQWLADYQHSRQPAVVSLQENHQPADAQSAPSPTAAPAEPESTPPPATDAPQPAPAAPSSAQDDDGFEGPDD